ncbi:methyltransferase domain-containing protein [Maritimibacter alexandrii]|uniref:methyltransferase domain-containing protein n=1 Tax=Maritimibacter alexandrii TaxID=2570355 RepID=UPI0011083077|nr:methyltransferase domain-containing protein [Maritimibacter alexandrii]
MYGPALALIHAEAFSDTFRPAFDWLTEQVYAGPRPARLFDLGCGDGAWLDFARYHGIPGAGLDASEAFVHLALARKLAVTLGDAARPLVPRGTSAITALGEVLAYAPAGLTGATQAAAQALPPNGLFLFDLIRPDVEGGETERHGNGWTIVAKTRISGARLTRDITVTTPQGTTQETHEQQIFDPGAVTRLVADAGFSCDLLASYGPCPLLPGRFAILARKLA